MTASATLITADDFRECFDVDSEIADRRLNPAIGSASRRLRKWIGEAVYAAAIAAAATDEAKCDLSNAEAHLAMHYAILGLNTPFTLKGIVATSASAEGHEMRKYLAPKETAELAQMYLDSASEIARDYIVATDSPVPVVNEDVDPVEWPTSDQL